MNMKSLRLLVSVASLAFVGAANAQQITGSFGVVVDPFVTPTSSYTASSLTLSPLNLITSGESGILSNLVPAHSDLTAYATTITGLSTSPLADSITNFFVFSTPDAILATSGTTPTNRFDFNLATITEVSSSPPSGGAVFTGTGTLVDTQGAYADTPAIFTLSFPGDGSTYSFTFAAVAVPEPTTISLVVIGLLGALTVRRRKA